MGVFHPYPVRCVCGTTFMAQMADGVNAERMPDMRTKIIRGELHQFICPNCQRKMTIEKELLYTDFGRNTIIKVMPRKERFRWKEASELLEYDVQRVPQSMLPNGSFTRVVFGLGELREKLIAQDADLDDRMVELLKAFLIYEHPFLIQRPRLRMYLDKVSDERFEFVSCYDHSSRSYRLGFPRPIVDNILNRKEEMEKWVNKKHTRSSIFSLNGDYWINFRRWSPRPWALDYLRNNAKVVRQGKVINTKSKEFRTMLDQLPRGNELQSWAKRDLRDVFLYAKKKRLSKLQDQLFEIRFGIKLEDDWAMNNDPDDIDTLWKLLKDLPDTNVEGNSFINELYLAEGEGGGYYQPGPHDIYIGSKIISNHEKFQDVVRHEVGHAVHEKFDNVVTPWLTSRFGWQRFRTSTAQIDQWIELMGGWGDITSDKRVDIRRFLIDALGGGGSWNPGPAPNPPAGHPWLKNSFGPRLAYERTGSNWFERNDSWYRASGKAFFLNFWYKELMIVNDSTLQLINTGMPSKYAAMSPFEFFAELYAVYYDLDDPKRPNLPDDVVKWFDKNIGGTESDAPLRPAHRSGGKRIRRPSK